jgi:hypothetical protein
MDQLTPFFALLTAIALAGSGFADDQCSFIGPKGGETRPGIHDASSPMPIDRVERITPEFLGPKGGDTRKSPPLLIDVASAQSSGGMEMCDSGHYYAWILGPKGADTVRKARDYFDSSSCKFRCDRLAERGQQ